MKLYSLTALRKSLIIVGASLALSSAPSFAASFSLSTGVQPGNVGTITTTQVNATTVNVLVDLLPGYGFLNTGGPHTPFAFTLAGSEANVSAVFLTPAGGSFLGGPAGNGAAATLSLSTTDGSATPFGTFGVSILSSAGNGSAAAYFGDLSVNISRVGGLSVTDFIANSDGYFFAADLTNGQNTGSQAWGPPVPGTGVPDGGSTVALLGLALGALGLVRRKLS